MIFIPTEIISLISENITNSKDKLTLQQVCQQWHEPAKRAFYKHIVISEQHDESKLDYNRTSTFTKFIRSMSASETSLIRIPPPGQYVKKLRIGLDVILENKFMPTATDYQLLATACPNLEEFDFPANMIWNYLISADINHYWKKMKRVPAFRMTPSTNAFELERFLYFKSSLTTLIIDYHYTNQQEEQFKQMITLFTNLERLKITTSTQSFTRMIPILAECCPNITKLDMSTTTSSVNEIQTNIVVPRLYQLRLNVQIMTPQILNAIINNFPDMQKLVLRMQQSAVGLEHLINFITSRLSQSSIHLFVSSNGFTTTVEQFILSARPIINITYDSRSSFTTCIPDLSFKHRQNQKELFVRYQGPISSLISNMDLPHMQLIREHGFYIQHLKIQSPSSLLNSEKNNDSQEKSCIQSILMDQCPNLSTLNISRCFFDLKESTTKLDQLQWITLESSTITHLSLKHLSHSCNELKYMELNQCEFDDSAIDMPKTRFKKLYVIEPCNTAEITLYEISSGCITNCHYSNEDRSLTMGNLNQVADTHLYINCYSMDQFRFNHIPLYK